jgi:hypothetical protein
MSKDPTHGSLAAALLDQKVAGLFHDKQYAYVPVIGGKGSGKAWGVGIAVEGEHGYCPIEDKTDADQLFAFASREEANDFCNGMNEHIGLSRIRAIEITVSSMRKPNKLRLVVEDQ